VSSAIDRLISSPSGDPGRHQSRPDVATSFDCSRFHGRGTAYSEHIKLLIMFRIPSLILASTRLAKVIYCTIHAFFIITISDVLLGQ
jgi:hypothetical protein